MREHTREPLPGVDLPVHAHAPHLVAHVVERPLQFPLARQQAPQGQGEHEVLIAHRLAHEVRSVLQHLLVAQEEHQQRNGPDSQSDPERHPFFILAYNVCRVMPSSAAARLTLP